MSHFLRTTPWIAMLTICLLNSLARGQEKLVERAGDLLPGDHRACVFADDQVAFYYSEAGRPEDAIRPIDWQVDWSLMAGVRTIARGNSRAINPADSDAPFYRVKISTPTLRESVVLPVQLRMTWTAGERKYQHNRPLFIFSRDPFATQQTFLEEAQIKLFDADGKTAELLDENEIPHSRLLNLSAIDLVTEGIVLVGEGVSFREQRKLAESLMRAAGRGVSVLCLAPSEGHFSLPIDEHGKKNQPIRFLLEREDFVRQYDKRFDPISSVSNLSLASLRNEVVVSVDDDLNDGPNRWSLLNLEFPSRKPKAAGGRLMVCCSGIVSHWETGPVPRYLLVHLLQELTKISSTKEKENVSIQK